MAMSDKGLMEVELLVDWGGFKAGEKVWVDPKRAVALKSMGGKKQGDRENLEKSKSHELTKAIKPNRKGFRTSVERGDNLE